MPVAKLKASNYPDVMKSDEGNDSLDTIIRQAIGKEPFLSFSRAGESPVQWIQLLHALDQQELPGWPLLSPLKVQMQKCEKCSREFCSVINYRRHIRVHHRLKKLDKDFTKSRELLAAFWDELSWEETKEVVSFKNILFEGIHGSAIIKNLTALIGKPGFSALPHVYLRAGSALLDIVQGRPSRFPISSQDLFEILDNASEKTFLCGTAVSMQKYVFDGEAAKIGLETKNLVACMSFLLEQKLVKAWLADKDAEALRCQKLLVEEEEAAQKRQAELLERKRQKKLRQKEQRSKEHKHEEKADVDGSVDELIDDVTPEESSSPQTEYHSERHSRHSPGILPNDIPSFEAFQQSFTDEDEDSESHSRFHSGYPDLPIDQNGEQQKVQVCSHKHVIAQWQVLPKSQRGLPNGFRTDQNYQGLKIGDLRRLGNHVQSRPAPTVNGKKVWSRKPKPERDGDRFQARVQEEATAQAEEIKSHEVLIGSISVALGNCDQESKDPVGTQDDCAEGHQTPKKINQSEKFIKPDSIQTGMNRVMVKLWRPVSRNGSKCPIPDQSENGESEAEVIVEKREDQTLLNAYSPRSSSSDGDTGDFGNNPSLLEETVQPVGLEFSSHAAKAFLAQRWKEAITADHIKLNLPSDSESSGCLEIQSDSETSAFQSSNLDKRNILGNAMLINLEAPKSSTNEAGKTKFRTKFEKGAKIKYIPKLRTAT